MRPCQGRSREFKSRLPLQKFQALQAEAARTETLLKFPRAASIHQPETRRTGQRKLYRLSPAAGPIDALRKRPV